MGSQISDKLADEVAAEEAAADDESVPYEEQGDSELDADPPVDGPEPTPPDLVPPGGPPPPAGLISIDNLLGVSLHYQKTGSTVPTHFRLMPGFRSVLEATVRQVRNRAPAEFGTLERIVSLGMYTPKGGAHGQGVANDWAWLRFQNLEISPHDNEHASPSLAKRQRYWALAAICRSNSAFVLHGFYDRHHENHIHQDTWATLAFNQGSQANVKLFQAVLNDIFGTTPKLGVDGRWGDKSRMALASAQSRLGIVGDATTDTTVLQKFLRASGRLGFRLSIHI